MSWREEMESHIAMRAEANERAGMDPGDARRAAERAFGNRGRISEEVRAVNVPVWLDQLGQDLRYAMRGFVRSPGFTITAAAALAVGIGTSTAVFSFVDRILFRPLPYVQERDLVWFGMTAPIVGATEFILDENYMAWRKEQTPFAPLTVTAGTMDCSLSELNPARLRCSRVGANFLRVFGYRPLAGRDFSEADAKVGAPQVALISRALWMERFGGSEVSGKTLEIDGSRTAVIGVLPENFEMPSLARVDVLQVLQLEENKARSAGSLVLTAFARLRPGVTLLEARTRMEPLFQEALQWAPRGFRKEVRFVINPLRDRQVRDSKRAALLLLGAVSLVLLISVANVANLLLARTAARRRELAVRAAIGAGKARLARQTLIESLSLGALGGVNGLLVATLLLHVFRKLAPAGIARLDEATLDWRIAGFSLLAAITGSLLFGLAPAMRSPSPETLTGGRIAGRRREWLRPALVISQIGLSLVLLCGAALLMQSLRNMANAPLGMETSSLFSASAQLPGARYPHPAQRAAFWNSLSRRLAAVPGVEAVGIADSLPPEGRAQGRIYSSIHVEGRPRSEGQPTGGMVTVREVSPSYFRMLRIPVRKGRLFTEGEKQAIVLSERMAARMFSHENALGQRIVLTGETTLEVTGIVGDVRNGGLTVNSDPEIYLLSNRERPRQYMLLRADTRVMPFVREAFRELDPRLTVQMETLDERVRNMRVRPRFQSMLLGGFAAAGLLLAAIGLYGVMAFLTTQRTGEIGVRMALGASPGDIRTMVLRQAGWWTVAGVATGLCGAAACVKLTEGLLYGVKATAALPLVSAVVVLMFAVLMAAWLPARRASHVAPVEALREL
ncbi:MAG: ABC transporter permease [Bryobacterales bacterium]|nr:ABC transporter permease [Bryobacterales bacterium]